jgi:hypothetical protein
VEVAYKGKKSSRREPMKREFALRLGLKLLGLCLVVGPILAAFTMHDWDVVAAVIDLEGLRDISGPLENMIDENAFERQLGGLGNTVEDLVQQMERGELENTLVEIPLEFPPFSFPVTLTEISISIGGVPVLRMKDEAVELRPGSPATVYLVGDLGAISTSENLEMGVEIGFEWRGVEVRMMMAKQVEAPEEGTG